MSDFGQAFRAYVALINEGTQGEQERWMNRDVLIEVWPRLILPPTSPTRALDDEISSAANESVAMSLLEFQSEVTQIALTALEPYGFVLAGSGAIREHGLITRPTEDIDLFSVLELQAALPAALDRLVEVLDRHRFDVHTVRRSDSFATVHVCRGDLILRLDLGFDYRAHMPVRLGVGLALDRKDAVGAKVAALFSRHEARDYLDVDAIRQSGIFADDELMGLGESIDAGFDRNWFSKVLRLVEHVPYAAVKHYGLSRDEFTNVQGRLVLWADAIVPRHVPQSRRYIINRLENRSNSSPTSDTHKPKRYQR